MEVFEALGTENDSSGSWDSSPPVMECSQETLGKLLVWQDLCTDPLGMDVDTLEVEYPVQHRDTLYGLELTLDPQVGSNILDKAGMDST